jgi:uncharacterized protein (DUF2141 family)
MRYAPIPVRWNLAVASAALALLVAGTLQAAELVVEVRNVKPRRGEVRAALFDNKEDFQAATRIRAIVKDGEVTTGVFTRDEDFVRDPVATMRAPAQGRTVTLRFTDIDPGVYALGVYQDLNNDEKLDITLGGLSLEPWGISNDSGDLDADPVWDNARFELPPEGASIVVHLLHEREVWQQRSPR